MWALLTLPLNSCCARLSPGHELTIKLLVLDNRRICSFISIPQDGTGRHWSYHWFRALRHVSPVCFEWRGTKLILKIHLGSLGLHIAFRLTERLAFDDWCITLLFWFQLLTQFSFLHPLLESLHMCHALEAMHVFCVILISSNAHEARAGSHYHPHICVPQLVVWQTSATTGRTGDDWSNSHLTSIDVESLKAIISTPWRIETKKLILRRGNGWFCHQLALEPLFGSVLRLEDSFHWYP